MSFSSVFPYEKKNLTVDGQTMTVAGNHFLQEDSPDEMDTAIAEWITTAVRA